MDDKPCKSIPFDVLIVGGGLVGLAALICLKQLFQETGYGLSICVIDKGRYLCMLMLHNSLCCCVYVFYVVMLNHKQQQQ